MTTAVCRLLSDSRDALSGRPIVLVVPEQLYVIIIAFSERW